MNDKDKIIAELGKMHEYYKKQMYECWVQKELISALISKERAKAIELAIQEIKEIYN